MKMTFASSSVWQCIDQHMSCGGRSGKLREVREVVAHFGRSIVELKTFLNEFAKATRDYPYAWHLHGRKRLWEIRVQMRLKQAGLERVEDG